MYLTEVKTILNKIHNLSFRLPNGKSVPENFHITEIGNESKKFIDCGGTIRYEQKVNFQLWHADDLNHRLPASKLLKIISLAEQSLNINPDSEVVVEFQGDTIERYQLDFDGTDFLLISKFTDCLAKDKCGIETPDTEVIQNNNFNSKCDPTKGCC